MDGAQGWVRRCDRRVEGTYSAWSDADHQAQVGCHRRRLEQGTGRTKIRQAHTQPRNTHTCAHVCPRYVHAGTRSREDTAKRVERRGMAELCSTDNTTALALEQAIPLFPKTHTHTHTHCSNTCAPTKGYTHAAHHWQRATTSWAVDLAARGQARVDTYPASAILSHASKLCPKNPFREKGKRHHNVFRQ
jgi:hypothetical protein